MPKNELVIVGRTTKIKPSKEQQEIYEKRQKEYQNMTDIEKSKDLRVNGQFKRTPSQVGISEGIDSKASNLKLAEKGNTIVLRVN